MLVRGLRSVADAWPRTGMDAGDRFVRPEPSEGFRALAH